MPNPNLDQMSLHRSFEKLPQRLNAANMDTLIRARQFRVQATLDPAKLVRAKETAKITVNALKAKAAARRSPALAKMVDQQAKAMSSAHTRIIKILQGASSRSPSAVISSFLNRAQSNQRTLAHADRSSLLIRSSNKDLPTFTAKLAKAMGLRAPSELRGGKQRPTIYCTAALFPQRLSRPGSTTVSSTPKSTPT